MDRCQLILVRSHTPAVRRVCASLLLTFLLDYPLAPKRLTAHLSFLTVNLAYEHEAGREAVIQMIHLLLEKFPEKAVEARTEFFFLPLAARLTSDASPRIRKQVAAALSQLFRRLPAAPLLRLQGIALTWLNTGAVPLMHTAALCLGLAIDATPAMDRQIDGLLPTLFAALERASGLQGSGGREEGEAAGEAQFDLLSQLQQLQQQQGGSLIAASSAPQSGSQPWQAVYAILRLLERVSLKLPPSSLPLSLAPLWPRLPALLIHPHAWPRAVAARLLGSLFNAIGQEGARKLVADLVSEGGASHLDASFLLLNPSYLLLLAACLCCVLEHNRSDTQLTEQAVKNLVFITPLLAAVQFELVDRRGRGSVVGGEEEGEEAPGRAGDAWIGVRRSPEGGRGEERSGGVDLPEGSEQRLKQACRLLHLKSLVGRRRAESGAGEEGEEEGEEDSGSDEEDAGEPQMAASNGHRARGTADGHKWVESGNVAVAAVLHCAARMASDVQPMLVRAMACLPLRLTTVLHFRRAHSIVQPRQ